MCSPIGDGSAAVVVTTPEIAARWGASPVTVLATMIGASNPGIEGELVPGVARRAFEQAGVAPSEVSVLECHDATAPAELIVLEELGIAGPGQAVQMIRDGVTSIGGALPVNPSGGLESKGHPVGASGIAQLVSSPTSCAAAAAPGRSRARDRGGGERRRLHGPGPAVATVTILGRR